MDGSQEQKMVMFQAEDVLIGERSSRISSVIFFLLCMLPVFSTILFGGVDNTTWIFISIFWAAIILLWLAESWKGSGILLNPSSLLLPMIGLFAIGLVQLLPLSGGSGGDLLSIPAVSSLSMEPYATRFFVTRLLVYIVFFAGCLTFTNNEKRLKKAVLLVIIFGFVMAFYGIIQRLANPEGIYGLRGTPQSIPFGPFVNQHHFAAFMQMTGGVAFAFLLGDKISRDKKILLAIAVVTMGVAAVLTSSRGGILGFVSVLVVATVLTFLSRKWSGRANENGEQTAVGRKLVIAGGVVALILVIFALVLMVGGNESLFRGIGLENADADVSSGRLRFWPIAIKIFLSHPIIGAGFDAFAVAFTKYDTSNGLFRVEQAHNEYLQTLADAGISGFICIAGFIGLLFKNALAVIKNSADSFRQYAAIGALAGCFGIMFHSFFDFPLRTPSNAFFFLLLCAIATIPVDIKHHHAKHRRRRTIT
ncbi:hypothetical protein BH10ACI3_BH10ACI3_07490 [soil metagenome]